MINCSQFLSSTCPVHENQVKVKVSIKRSVLHLDEDIVMILTAIGGSVVRSVMGENGEKAKGLLAGRWQM